MLELVGGGWPLRFISAAADTNAVLDLSSDYQVQYWTTDQGLPQNTVACVGQTPDGYLWIGTRAGLARYDGKFKLFADEPAFSNPGDVNIRDLTQDSQGRCWVRTSDSLICYESHQFRRYSFRDEPLRGEVRQFLASPKGGLWLLFTDRLCHFESGVITRSFEIGPKPRPIQSSIELLRADAAGHVWLLGSGTCGRLNPEDGKLEQVSEVVGSAFSRIPTGLFVDRAGRLWLSSPGELFCWANGALSRRSLPEVWGDVAAVMVEDRAGDLWIRVPRLHQVIRLRGDQFTVCYSAGDRLSSRDIRCLWPDHEGNIWAGTGDGLVKLRPRSLLSLFTTNASGEKNEVFSVAPSREGGVWIGTASGLVRYKSEEFITYTNSRQVYWHPHFENKSAPVLEDELGAVWFGVGQEGFHTLRNGQFTPALPPRAHPDQNKAITALFEDRDQNIWIGTHEGLICWREKILARYTRRELSDDHIVGILQSPDGSLWIGTEQGGLNHFQNGRFEVLTTTTGLCSDWAKPLRIEPDGTVWVGTLKGVNRIREGRVRSLTTRNGLFTDEIYCLLDDDRGNFWANSNRGIWRAKSADFNAVADGRTNRLECAVYGLADGMVSSEGNGDHQPSACKSSDGRLWFPTTMGVFVVDPATLIDNDTAPPVIIEQVKTDGTIIYGDGASPSAKPNDGASRTSIFTTRQPGIDEPVRQLKPGSARVLEIHYTANSFVAPERVRFKYRLVGCDSDWRTDDNNSRVVYYPNLPPGPYTFRVQACNNHGVWNLKGASFAFYLMPRFYQTALFYVACGMTVIGGAAGLQSYRLRVQRKILALEQQAALGRERTRIAQDMHDDLGASLTKIAILSEIAKRDLDNKARVETDVEQISATARTVVDNISELVWATNPKNDTLDNLAAYLREYTAHYFEATTIQVRLDFPEEAPAWPVKAELRRGLFLVVKEASHNMVKHSGASETAVRMQLERLTLNAQRSTFKENRIDERAAREDVEMIVLDISDNGRGFDVNTVSRFSNGLENMRRRIAELGGTFDLQSSPGHGSQIRILVPLTVPAAQSRL